MFLRIWLYAEFKGHIPFIQKFMGNCVIVFYHLMLLLVNSESTHFFAVLWVNVFARILVSIILLSPRFNTIIKI